MDSRINRVGSIGAVPARPVPPSDSRKQSREGSDFQSELVKQHDEDEQQTTELHEEQSDRKDRHISPLADGDPGSTLDLTA